MDYIAEQLRPLAVPIADLHEDPANARKGHAVDRIAASLKQYGQRKPIVVNRLQGGKIIAGNGTFRAAKSLGWTHIAVVFVEDDAATAAAYGIADNRVGEFSEWDFDALTAIVPDLGELFTGFSVAEMDFLTAPLHALENLVARYGEPDERDFWPVIRVQVDLETMELWRSFLKLAPGGDDSAKVTAILAAVDATLLNTE